jgi:hypothetical protein
MARTRHHETHFAGSDAVRDLLRGGALEQATDAVTAERNAWVRFMMREELGLEEPARKPRSGARSASAGRTSSPA